MIKKPLLAFWFTCAIVAAATMVTMAWLCSYYANLQPKLFCTCSLDAAKLKCQEILEWTTKRNPWEWVPDKYINMICPELTSADGCVFATYESKIDRFEPYSFHSTKGTLIEGKGRKETFYIYVWDKRYRPMIAP